MKIRAIFFLLLFSGCTSVTRNGFAEAPQEVFHPPETVKEWSKTGTWFRDCSDENKDVPTFVIAASSSSTQMSLRLPEKSYVQLSEGTRFNLRVDSIICNDDKLCANIKGGTLDLIQKRGMNWQAKFVLDDGLHPQSGTIWFVYNEHASVPCGS